MPIHTDSHALHTTLGAIQGPGDTLYKGATVAVALLILLTALI